MVAEAEVVVAQGSFGAPTRQGRIAFMRYVGQGHEIPVPLPARRLVADDVAAIRAAYDTQYSRFYDRPVPGSDVEILSYAVTVATIADYADAVVSSDESSAARPSRMQAVRDTASGEVVDWDVYDRASLGIGATLRGPAIVAEDETSTLVGPGWTARIERHGYIEMVRKP